MNPRRIQDLGRDRADDSAGRLTEVDGAGGLSKTIYTLNADSRMTAEERYKTSSTYDTWTLLQDWIGDQSKVTDGNSKVTQSVRDDLGRLVELTSADIVVQTIHQ